MVRLEASVGLSPIARTARRAPLFGLLLAGGASRRMGEDKGAIRYGDAPQARAAWRLLEEVCAGAFVSINPSQRSVAPYADLPVIVDAGLVRGPAAGLFAAWLRYPDVAWLVLAVDLPRVDRGVLETLIAARHPHRAATALRHVNGVLEPLCTIWEPAARPALAAEIAAGGASLRRVLERASIAVAELADPAVLASVNTLAERAALSPSGPDKPL
jgi:molybdenum cofactor guanylyltransferase